MPTDVVLPTGEALEEYDGQCLELVNELLHEHPEGAILYVEPLGRRAFDVGYGGWKYHAALLLDGIVHDAWFPEARLPPEEYIAHVFGARPVVWEINPGHESELSELEEGAALASGAS